MYCVHVYPLDVYYPLDKERGAIQYSPPSAPPPIVVRAGNERERERWDLSIAFPTPPPSQNGLGKTNKNNESEKESKQLANPFRFGDCKRLDDLSSLSHRRCLLFLCTRSHRPPTCVCVCVCLFFVVLRCFTTANFHCWLFFFPRPRRVRP